MTVTRGTSNTNARGSSADRRSRKLYLLATFGDGTTVTCYSCPAVLTYDTLQTDRIIPGRLGGTYARPNIRPACGPCNIRSGIALRELLRRAVPVVDILDRCRLGLL